MSYKYLYIFPETSTEFLINFVVERKDEGQGKFLTFARRDCKGHEIQPGNQVPGKKKTRYPRFELMTFSVRQWTSGQSSSIIISSNTRLRVWFAFYLIALQTTVCVLVMRSGLPSSSLDVTYGMYVSVPPFLSQTSSASKTSGMMTTIV